MHEWKRGGLVETIYSQCLLNLQTKMRKAGCVETNLQFYRKKLHIGDIQNKEKEGKKSYLQESSQSINFVKPGSPRKG